MRIRLGSFGRGETLTRERVAAPTEVVRSIEPAIRVPIDSKPARLPVADPVRVPEPAPIIAIKAPAPEIRLEPVRAPEPIIAPPPAPAPIRIPIEPVIERWVEPAPEPIVQLIKAPISARLPEQEPVRRPDPPEPIREEIVIRSPAPEVRIPPPEPVIEKPIWVEPAPVEIVQLISAPVTAPLRVEIDVMVREAERAPERPEPFPEVARIDTRVLEREPVQAMIREVIAPIVERAIEPPVIPIRIPEVPAQTFVAIKAPAPEVRFVAPEPEPIRRPPEPVIVEEVKRERAIPRELPIREVPVAARTEIVTAIKAPAAEPAPVQTARVVKSPPVERSAPADVSYEPAFVSPVSTPDVILDGGEYTRPSGIDYRTPPPVKSKKWLWITGAVVAAAGLALVVRRRKIRR